MVAEYRDRIGHRKLVRLALAWRRACLDPKVSESERGRLYRAMTAHIDVVQPPVRR